MYQFKNLLVTGAAGFIGSNFVRMLLDRFPSVQVVSYDALTYAGSLDNLSGLEDEQRHTFVKGDIQDERLVLEVLRKYRIDTLVHFAAESHVDNSILGPKLFFETNVLGTFNLAEQARKYWFEELALTPDACRFHHVSTDEVYGTLSKEAAPFAEEHKYEPSSPYSASKAASDHVVYSYCRTYGLPVTISNCSNNYGPYQHAEKLIPVVLKNCFQGKGIPVYGDGSNIRDWLYAEDHCDAISHILQRGVVGETYNIGGDNEIDNLSLVKKICSLMDRYRPQNAPHERLITFVEDRKGHDWRYAIDNSKIKQELGWELSLDFESKLETTIEFYLKMWGVDFAKMD